MIMPIENWEPIPDHPDYLISDRGQVYNRRMERLMSLNKTMQGDLKVTLSDGGERSTRSVRVLVAEAFVEKPYYMTTFHKSAIPDTVIVLDGNQEHVSAYNLAWRPRWFANQYARQFKVDIYPPEYYDRAVQNIATGAIYSSVIRAAQTEGLLYHDVYRSACSRKAIYPDDKIFIFP
jgi:hypothetical protein